MSEFPGYSRIYDREQFEREKLTRIMPESLKESQRFILRLMMPPDKAFEARDYGILLYEKRAIDRGYSLKLVANWDASPVAEPELKHAIINHNGFIVVDNPGKWPDLPAEVERGYFLGSTDEWDLSLAEIVHLEFIQTKELAAY